MKAIHSKQVISAVLVSLVLILGLTGLSFNALGDEPAQGWEFHQTELGTFGLNLDSNEEEAGFQCPLSHPVFNGCDARERCSHSCPTWHGGVALVDETKEHCDIHAYRESPKAGFACCCRRP